MIRTALPDQQTLSEPARRSALACGVEPSALAGNTEVVSPLNGAMLATVTWSGAAGVDAAVACAMEAFKKWRVVPAPVRGA